MKDGAGFLKAWEMGHSYQIKNPEILLSINFRMSFCPRICLSLCLPFLPAFASPVDYYDGQMSFKFQMKLAFH